METFNIYEKKLKGQIDTEFSTFGNVINLLKFSFATYQCKLLNKNLNFYLTPERCEKTEVILTTLRKSKEK